MTQDERESQAEWKRLDYNAEIQRQHDTIDLNDCELGENIIDTNDIEWPEDYRF